MPIFKTLLRPLTRQSWWPRPGNGMPLDELLNSADATAPLVERHLWLIQLIDCVRREDPVSGTQHVVRLLATQPERRARVVAMLSAFWRDMDVAALLADYGFSPRTSFLNELGERVRRKSLPSTPDTNDLAKLFALLFDDPLDAEWLAKLDDDTLVGIASLWRDALITHANAVPPAEASPLGWREPFYDAIGYLISQVRAAGMSPAFRSRLGTRVDDGFDPETPLSEQVQLDQSVEAAAEQEADFGREAFRQIGKAAERLYELALSEARDQGSNSQPSTALLQEAHYLRALLDRCAAAARGLHGHLEAQGISVDLVFQIDQLCARCLRVEQLLEVVLSPNPAPVMRNLLCDLNREGQARRSVRALFSRHYAMLARKVAERSAETGEHYITRNGSEYRDMLSRAAGGGAVIAGTTYVKFLVMAMALSPFWTGMGAGLNYAVSFVIVQLLHWTVATKQPAMTAPAMAAKLADTRTDAAIEGFVDEVAHLTRSQTAGIVGNLVAVAPLVLAAQLLSWWIFGAPLIGEEKAKYVLHSMTLLGPTLWYAAFTGVLLFASSLIAGWVENWFVLHRLDSALRWNPRIRLWVGPERAAHWSAWWRENISGLAANVSLGFMLGVVPVVASFLALPLDVRHVTLSTGQIMAAAGTLGPVVLHEPAFWWCVAAIPLTGMLNVGVSFVLALRVAVRSRNVRVADRARLWAAIRRRMLTRPFSFLFPPKQGKATAAKH